MLICQHLPGYNWYYLTTLGFFNMVRAIYPYYFLQFKIWHYPFCKLTFTSAVFNIQTNVFCVFFFNVQAMSWIAWGLDTFVVCEKNKDGIGLVQKWRNAKFLNINILYSPETHVYLVTGYSMLMLKIFVLLNFWITSVLRPFLQSCAKCNRKKSLNAWKIYT